MTTPETLLSLLDPLRGIKMTVGQRSGVVIEVMADPPALVLQAGGRANTIQADHLGRPQSMTHTTWTVSLFGESGRVLHPDLQRQIEPKLASAINACLTDMHTDRE